MILRKLVFSGSVWLHSHVPRRPPGRTSANSMENSGVRKCRIPGMKAHGGQEGRSVKYARAARVTPEERFYIMIEDVRLRKVSIPTGVD